MTRPDPNRKNIILNIAVTIASQPGGWAKLTRQQIASEAGVSTGLVSMHLGDMIAVRKAIVRRAVKREIVEILLQSIAAHDGYVVTRWLSPSLHQKVAARLLEK